MSQSLVELKSKQNISCRVCFDTKCNEAISLKENHLLLDLFKFCVDIVIDLNVRPHILCKKCADEIKFFAKFKQKCKVSEEFWKSCKNENNVSCDQNICKVVKKESLWNKSENSKTYNILSNQLDHKEINGSIGSYTYTDEVKIPMYNITHEMNTECEINISHNLVNDSQKVYQCDKCKREFTKYKWLKHHTKVCYLNKKKKVNQITIKKEELDDKVIKYHCGLCDLSFENDKIKLKEHLNEHWFKNDLICKLCDFVGRDFADMITHRYLHYPNEAASCPACDKRVVALTSLQYHFRSVHLHKPGGLCSYCDKVFTTCKTWNRHERLHTDNRLFVCDLCGRKFLYKYQIEAHLIDHSDVRQFVCETCGKAFKRMSALKGHLETVHEPSSPVVCEHCNRTYKNKEKLELHLKKLSEYKPFQCAVCSKRYVLASELKSHMFWHTDERPHVCEICGSKYKAKGQLKVHMRNHTGERPFKCGICGKGFGTTSQVKRHKSVHTGVRAHKCLCCRRSFHGLKALLEHSLQHKNGESKTKSES